MVWISLSVRYVWWQVLSMVFHQAGSAGGKPN